MHAPEKLCRGIRVVLAKEACGLDVQEARRTVLGKDSDDLLGTHGMYNPLETLEEVILSIEQRITLIVAQCSYYCV